MRSLVWLSAPNRTIIMLTNNQKCSTRPLMRLLRLLASILLAGCLFSSGLESRAPNYVWLLTLGQGGRVALNQALTNSVSLLIIALIEAPTTPHRPHHTH